MQKPKNRSSTYSQLYSIENGIEQCMDMQWHALLVKNCGLTVVILQLYHQVNFHNHKESKQYALRYPVENMEIIRLLLRNLQHDQS
jgi:hypothetical protein